MNKETARMWLLMTTPSMFLLVLPDYAGITNIKEQWTTFRVVFDFVVCFLFCWSVVSLVYIALKDSK
jgi:hypothetical protein